MCACVRVCIRISAYYRSASEIWYSEFDSIQFDAARDIYIYILSGSYDIKMESSKW